MDKEKEKILREIIESTIWMAARYAHGRHTYAPGLVRRQIEQYQELYPEFKVNEDYFNLPPPTDEQLKESGAHRDDWLDDLCK